MAGKRIVIGLTGPIAGGKGVVAEWLKEQGFFYSSTSDRVREEVRRRGGEITRERLQKVADELREKYGPAVLAERTWRIVVSQVNPRAVIDSIRGEAEVDFLKKKEGFFLIGVTAPARLRFERMRARGRESDPQTWEEFLKVDQRDHKSGQGKRGRDIKKCLAKADLVLVNDKRKEDLIKEVEKVIGSLLKEEE